VKVSTLTLSRRHKGKKAAYVRPIKASDERTLENAIIMANQLASKSMHDLDKRCVDDMFNASPQESQSRRIPRRKSSPLSFPAAAAAAAAVQESGVADPDTDTHVFGPPGSFYHQAKNSKKNLDSYCFVTSF
jgi:hypothetical protein